MPRPTALFAIATLLVGYGLFGFDRSGATTRPSYLAGLALMAELLRQAGCPLFPDQAAVTACLTAYGEMTAPVLSFGAGVPVLLFAFARWRRKRAHVPSAVTETR